MSLIGGETCQAFEEFDEKYSQFMIQDGRWTMKNYDQMVDDHRMHAQWWKIVEEISDKFSLGIITTDHIRGSLSRHKLNHMSNDTLVDLLFNFTFEHNIKPVFERSPDGYSVDQRSGKEMTNNVTKAFMRYLCNQLFIFIKYKQVKNSEVQLKNILEFVDYIHAHAKSRDITPQEIDRIKNYINKFLGECEMQDFITKDERITYGHLFSIVNPFIIDYESKYPQTLDVVSSDLLNGTYTHHFVKKAPTEIYSEITI